VNRPVQCELQGLSESHFDTTLEKYFKRYDLDGTNTLNNSEEMEMLTLNLVSKLKVKVEEESIVNSLLALGDVTDNNAMDIAQYRVWLLAQPWMSMSF